MIKILGLVTARGGSKRLPGKNIKDFVGKPLIAWTAEVGIESKVFDRFVLTTDDEAIATTGKKAGLEVPFIRPSEYATDTAKSFDAIKHALDWLKDEENYIAPWVILLEPTSPGRQVFHIQEVAKLIEEGRFDSIIGISETPGHYSYLKALGRDDDGLVMHIVDGRPMRDRVTRNQDVPTSYYLNSAIYAFRTSNFYDTKPSLYGNSCYGYVMDEKYSLDIDTPDEWIVAEIKMKKLLEEK